MNKAYTPADGYPYYFSLAEHMDFDALFKSDISFSILKNIDEEKANYRYAAGKWNIKQLVGHITDHERIKIYRAYMLSRKSNIELWGYDQDSLVMHSRFEDLPFATLVEDFYNVRNASASFVKTLSLTQLELEGTAGGNRTTLKDFLRTIIGHEIHHIQILKEKYV